MTGAHVIDLGIGEPQPRLLPLDSFRQAAAHRLALPGNDYLQYAPEQGWGSLRGEIARFLTGWTPHPVEPDELLITAGASHGLDLVLSRCTRPGDTIVVEDPTYFFALEVFRDRGLRVLGVPIDGDGLDVDALDELLSTERPRLLYTVPVCNNPTGVTLSPGRRARLAGLAARHDLLIVADEVYHLLGDAGPAVPSLRAAAPDRVLSLGSFSKIFAPGLRLGWIHASRERLAHLLQDGELRSAGGASPVAGAVMESALALGLQDRFLKEIRELYAARRRHMVRLLAATLPPEVTFEPPDGGYYVWLRLPGHVDTAALLPAAAQAGVAYRPGSLCSWRGGHACCMRLCFVHYDEPDLTEGCERLAAFLRAHLRAL
ncbi:PLP-dependent aminotransferase family protein [Nonomuraea sp. NPDC049309]|uniref:aminotransferase-like domain-containing protein n=1 Tax=Nonomuraea sp. NPDC049309 TaxID=3364350 RepID=UPI0037176AA5